MSPRPRAEERPHRAPAAGGPDDGAPWSEAWWFDFATADGTLGGRVRFVRHLVGPHAGRAWYQAAVTGPHRQLLTVVDHDVPFRSNPLEIRTTGLWADHVCETPHDHWTIGLEAFALGVDDPLEVLGAARGDRVPLGMDLEWETEGAVVDLPDGDGAAGGYVEPCRVYGELLVGADEIDLAAVGHRGHRWGHLDWPGEAGWSVHGTHDGGRWWYVTCPDGHRGAVRGWLVDAGGGAQAVDGTGSIDLDADGLPTAVRVETDELVVRSEVLAPAPLRLPGADGIESVARHAALCRHRTGDGGIGVGWVEVRGVRRALDGGLPGSVASGGT